VFYRLKLHFAKVQIDETMVEPAHGLHIGQVGRFATQWANRPEVSRMKDVKIEEVSLLYQMIVLRANKMRQCAFCGERLPEDCLARGRLRGLLGQV
jgi:hypothetical protein